MMSLLDSITDSVDMNFRKLQEIVEDRGAQHAAVHEVAKSWTQLSDSILKMPLLGRLPLVAMACAGFE